MVRNIYLGSAKFLLDDSLENLLAEIQVAYRCKLQLIQCAVLFSTQADYRGAI